MEVASDDTMKELNDCIEQKYYLYSILQVGWIQNGVSNHYFLLTIYTDIRQIEPPFARAG